MLLVAAKEAVVETERESVAVLRVTVDADRALVAVFRVIVDAERASVATFAATEETVSAAILVSIPVTPEDGILVIPAPFPLNPGTPVAVKVPADTDPVIPLAVTVQELGVLDEAAIHSVPLRY